MNDRSDFRDRVLAVARELFPGVTFAAPREEPDVLLAGDMRMGLQNLRAKFELAGGGEGDLRNLVETHFAVVLRNEIPALDTLAFGDLRGRIFPQIMPAEYVHNIAVPLVSFPFAGGIRVGVVADFPQTYMYLRAEDTARWNVPEPEVYEVALGNLGTASENLDFQVVENGTETFVAIASGDGYDAARILVPGIQEMIAARLGETFRFAIPNRDFLICWRLDCAAEFHGAVSEKVAADYATRPYPLSASVFVRNAEGNFHEKAQRA